MKNFIYFLLFILSLAAFSPSANAAWPQPKGHGFFKLDFSFIRARDFYSMDGKIYNINGYGTQLGNYTGSFYGEYGLTNRLTAVTYFPFLVRNTVNEGIGAITGEVLQPGLENTALGDIDLGLRYNFVKKDRFVLSGTLMFGLPTGDYQNADLLYTGDGEFNQIVLANWGTSGNRWYATGYAGVNNRTKNFSDEFRFFGEYGYWVIKQKLLLAAKVSVVESFRNGKPETSGNGLFSNNVEYISPQLGVTWEHQNTWGITAVAAGAVAGTNVLAAPSFSVGIYWKLKKSK